MKRDFINVLNDWKDNHILTPLMVIGARQVGKTYIINKFCQENFNDYIYINLMENKRIGEIFKKNDSLDNIVQEFKLELKRDVNTDTIIFIDEIQESEELIAALKYFCEAEFPYKIIVAGSLLGVKLKRFHKSFPVGKVIIEYMYPLNFKEFLWAINKEKYIDLIEDCFKNDKAMPEYFHEELLKDYLTFLCTGGMPQIVSAYLEDKDGFLFKTNTFAKSIIDAYLSDMNKYTNNMYESIKIERIYKNIPNQLAKENKKYQVSKVNKNARYRDYESAMDWLVASKLVIPCYYVNKFETPLKAFMDEDNFKLYLSDVGLLNELMGMPYNNILLDNDFMFKGAIVENYVATELIKNNLDIYYYYVPQKLEIDFLIDTNTGIIPIEVKAGENVKSSSLNKFMVENNCKLGIRISKKNFGLENKIKSIPLYAVFCLNKNNM